MLEKPSPGARMGAVTALLFDTMPAGNLRAAGCSPCARLLLGPKKSPALFYMLENSCSDLNHVYLTAAISLHARVIDVRKIGKILVFSRISLLATIH
jgi:hypothetical protein